MSVTKKTIIIPEAWDLAVHALVEATTHIRDCSRCGRMFAAAHDAVGGGATRFEEFRPWGLVNLILPELRQCNAWPKEI
ncbi:MAG: hypothetical protein JO121_07300 [Deltaproteobacteria bacterium]|nr:hypothetical protein [Deltaproteobacteria bacterium]